MAIWSRDTNATVNFQGFDQLGSDVVTSASMENGPLLLKPVGFSTSEAMSDFTGNIII